MSKSRSNSCAAAHQYGHGRGGQSAGWIDVDLRHLRLRCADEPDTMAAATPAATATFESAELDAGLNVDMADLPSAQTQKQGP